ncbi:ABC transporter substrate-binding protein [soil metagenome]
MPVLSRIIVPVLLVSTLALAGCSSTGTLTSSLGTPTPTATIDPAAPVTVDNCGTPVTFTKAPERVITVKSTSTEMLLALGLGDRIVGTAFQDGPVPDKWLASAAAIPSIADKVPSEEVVLEKQPDLVYAGWESTFTPDGAGARDELAALGVASYVSPSACQSHNQPKKLGFDNIFGDISEIASIFRVDAAPLIAEQKATLAKVTSTKPGQDRTALWYSSGADTPYVGAGIGAPELVLESVGLKNIAADVNATWAPLNWEAIVAADPYYIVLVDATWNTAAKKISLLKSNPATANLAAVKQHRFLTVPFAASEAGVRTVETVESLAQQIRALNGP